MSLAGHFRTLGSHLVRRLRPLAFPASRSWNGTMEDPRVGTVRIAGRLADGGEDLMILVHGLGGSADSRYLEPVAHAAAAAGLSTLRLHLRGADRSGEDFYHAGLTDDLHAVLAAPDLAAYRKVFIVGVSLGGHMTLRFATQSDDPRLAAVAAISPPIDLAAAAEWIDRPGLGIYRRHLLRGLCEIYAEVAARRPVPTPVERVLAATRIVEFDDLVIAPRFGFADAADYYRQMSVGPRLSELRVPALVVAASGDPMVPVASVERWLGAFPDHGELTAHVVPGGGHVAFSRRLTLGVEGGLGLAPQVVSWLLGASSIH